MANTSPYHFPGVSLAGIFLEAMSPTFEYKADAMPTNFLG